MLRIFALNKRAEPGKRFCMITLIQHPDDARRLGDWLIENLSSSKWSMFRVAVAFVKNCV